MGHEVRYAASYACPMLSPVAGVLNGALQPRGGDPHGQPQDACWTIPRPIGYALAHRRPPLSAPIDDWGVGGRFGTRLIARRSMQNAGKACLLCLSFALGLYAGSAILGYILKSLYEPVAYWRQLDAFARAGKQYDTLVVGTSRVENGFDVECFDKDNERLGKSTKTANLGHSVLNILEVKDVIERALTASHGHIKRVILEPDYFNHFTLTGKDVTPRAIAYMSLSHAWEVYSYATHGNFPAFEPDLPVIADRYSLALSLLEKTFRHVTNLGMFWYALEKRSVGNEYDYRASNGFRQLGSDERKSVNYDEAVRTEIQWRRSAEFRLSDSQIALVEDIAVMTRKMRAKLYILLPPGLLWDQIGFVALSYQKPFSADIPVMDFADPIANAAILKEENFLDTHHLTSKGVAMFCEMLVRKMCELEKDCPGAPPP